MSAENQDYKDLFEPDDDPVYQQFLNEMRDPEFRKVKERLDEVDERFQTWFGQAREGDPEALRTPRRRRTYYTARATELLSQHWTPDLEVLFWTLEKFAGRDPWPKKDEVVGEILEEYGEEVRRSDGVSKTMARNIDSLLRPSHLRKGGIR